MCWAEVLPGPTCVVGRFDEGELPTYLQTMGRARTWGDELTLRAFADCFGVCVHVVASTDQNWHLVYSPPDGVPPKKTCFLTYLSPVHYDALTALPPFEDGAGASAAATQPSSPHAAQRWRQCLPGWPHG